MPLHSLEWKLVGKTKGEKTIIPGGLQNFVNRGKKATHWLLLFGIFSATAIVSGGNLGGTTYEE